MMRRWKMKTRCDLGGHLVTAILSAGLFFFAMVASAGAAGGPPALIVEDELIVQHKAGAPEAKVQDALHGQGALVDDEISPLRIKKIRVPAHAREKVRAALAKNPHFTFVESNHIAEPTITPNDSLFSSQWHLPKIAAPQGWDITTGSIASIIAVADSGVDSLHPDLAGKLVPGYNFYANTTDTRDVYGHGTWVAGAAAALSNNGSGVSGVSWGSAIMPIVITSSTGYSTYYAMAQAITYAADNGVRIINLSFAGTSASATLQNAVTYAWNKGTLVFASAGNYATSTPYYPAACEHAVAVTATTSADALAGFSNFGAWVDIAAPGASIYTTARGGGYASVSGTSFSSPIAAGLGALILSVNPNLTNAQVVEILRQNADDLGTAGFDPLFGYGRINVYKSLSAARSYIPKPDTEAPAVSLTSPVNGASVGGTTTVSVAANDAVGVTQVELYVDGALYAADATGPYGFSWDTTKYSDGVHTLYALAHDGAGNIGQSAEIAVTVYNPKDVTPPAVRIASPVQGATVGRRVVVDAGASDNVGVVRTELRIDGVLMTTASGGSLSYSWNAFKATPGSHTVTVKAFDGAGNSSTASTVVYK